MTTYIDIINIFKNLAGPLKKIKQFGNGDAGMVDLSDGINYPYLYLETPMITRTNGAEQWRFAFQVLQQTHYESPTNRDIMQSDCKQIGDAVMLYLYHNHKYLMPPKMAWDVVLFEQKYTDVVYGARFEFIIEILGYVSACDLNLEYEIPN